MTNKMQNKLTRDSALFGVTYRPALPLLESPGVDGGSRQRVFKTSRFSGTCKRKIPEENPLIGQQVHGDAINSNYLQRKPYDAHLLVADFFFNQEIFVFLN
jgi:hypothetical protein